MEPRHRSRSRKCKLPNRACMELCGLGLAGWYSPTCAHSDGPEARLREHMAALQESKSNPQNLQNRTLLCFPAGVVKTTRREKLTTVAQIVYKIKRNETKIIQITRQQLKQCEPEGLRHSVTLRRGNAQLLQATQGREWK